jgi:hypothetical protein
MFFRVDTYKRHDFSITGSINGKTKTVNFYYAVCGDSSEIALGFDSSANNFSYSSNSTSNTHGVGFGSASREISLVGTFTAASWDTYNQCIKTTSIKFYSDSGYEQEIKLNDASSVEISLQSSNKYQAKFPASIEMLYVKMTSVRGQQNHQISICG